MGAVASTVTVSEHCPALIVAFSSVEIAISDFNFGEFLSSESRGFNDDFVITGEEAD